ncbi:transcriptional regulator [Lactiplantibacillus plantarum]|nr:transcriptional regulator [Lactiplantibacillus plantarum]
MKSNIKRIVQESKLSISELSKISGLSRTTLSPLVNSEILPDKTRIETLKRISKALHITISELFEETPYTFAELHEGIEIDKFFYPQLLYPYEAPYLLLPFTVKTETQDFTSFITLDPVISVKTEDKIRLRKIIDSTKKEDLYKKEDQMYYPAELQDTVHKEIKKQKIDFEVTVLKLHLVTKYEMIALSKKKEQITASLNKEYKSQLFVSRNNFYNFSTAKGLESLSSKIIKWTAKNFPVQLSQYIDTDWYVPYFEDCFKSFTWNKNNEKVISEDPSHRLNLDLGRFLVSLT